MDYQISNFQISSPTANSRAVTFCLSLLILLINDLADTLDPSFIKPVLGMSSQRTTFRPTYVV